LRALLLFWHGIGDLICLTPALRALHEQGYHCDVMCMPYVRDSHLMDECLYVTPIPLPTYVSPSEGGRLGKKSKKLCMDTWHLVKDEYDVAFRFNKTPRYVRGGKIERNFRSCDLPPFTDPRLEVFIPPAAEETAREYIASHYPNGFIFQHTRPGQHEVHDWNADEWIRENLADLPVLDTGRGSQRLWDDINVFFVLAREATHRVLSSSVFVHACDAMDVEMDVVHYGAPNLHGLPLDASKIKLVKESYHA